MGDVEQDKTLRNPNVKLLSALLGVFFLRAVSMDVFE